MPRTRTLLMLPLLLLCGLLAPQSGYGDLQDSAKPDAPVSYGAPLCAGELQRFMADAPRFLRWARTQGLEYSVYPDPAALKNGELAGRTDAILQEMGWNAPRFIFLLCATGSAAAAQPPRCSRSLDAGEVALLRDSMLDLMTLYGTGP